MLLLMANEPNRHNTSTTGYRMRFGTSEIRLIARMENLPITNR